VVYVVNPLDNLTSRILNAPLNGGHTHRFMLLLYSQSLERIAGVLCMTHDPAR
jgi:hypothetical protein